jgi:hypothetical protein
MKERYWTTRNGNKRPIADMDDGHLVNTIAMLERNAEKAQKKVERIGGDLADWTAEALFSPEYGWLNDELEKRITTGQIKRGLGPTYKGARGVGANKPDESDAAVRFSLLELD